MRDVCATLEEIRLHIREGGLLIVKLPIDDIRSARQRGWSQDDSDWHLHTWTPRLFANVLYEAQFEVVDQRIITSACDPRLFWLDRWKLARFAFWALAVLKARRQLFAVACVPGGAQPTEDDRMSTNTPEHYSEA